MKTASAKQKGRKLQQLVRDKIIQALGLDINDVRSTSMGCGGVDITLSEAARKVFPYAVETKCQEKVNVWEAYKQAEEHALYERLEPLVVIKRNKSNPLVLLDLDSFISLVKKGVT